MVYRANRKRFHMYAGWTCLLLCGAAPAFGQPGQAPGAVIPEPVIDPLRIQLADDPLVAFLRRRTPDSEFIARIGAAVSANPSVEETRFLVEEAEAARREARSALFPTLDLALSSRTSLARDFSDDPDNIVERSRSRGRTDATFVVN
ncbi:MAG: TolC family protein, partial [Parasphingopyxis sp.]